MVGQNKANPGSDIDDASIHDDSEDNDADSYSDSENNANAGEEFNPLAELKV